MQNQKTSPKTESEIKLMGEGGKCLSEIKQALKEVVEVGNNAWEIEKTAVKMLAKSGGKASFKMVPNYSWATCVNVNDGVVHGIPKKETIFKKGDVVSVDVGMYYKGYHTDTSFSVGLQVDSGVDKFLKAGSRALEKSIGAATVGNRIYDISKIMQDTIESQGYNVVKSLVGHGIGKNLHEFPGVPCYVEARRSLTPEIVEGSTLAIELMYNMGGSDVILGDDGWTIYTRDGTISALFEETVAVTAGGPLVLTK
jgi:methionyl aminopeptidase